MAMRVSPIDRLTALPRPFPDPDLLQSNLEEGFRRFPKRLENYRKCQAAKRGEEVDYLPIRLDVENVSRCNYSCTMCQVSEWPGLKRAEDMSLEDFKALVDSQYGLIEIKLQGMGEPLMGKSYFEMIEYARARFIWVRSTTNGSLLHLKENYKRLIDTDICEIQLSLDGATAETFERIRRGSDFRRVTQNFKILNQYARQANRNRTRLWMTSQKDNFHELEQFPALAAELEFSRLTFALDLNDWGQPHWREANDRVDMHSQFTLERSRSLMELGRKHGVEVTFWFIDDKYESQDPSKLCPWPFERAYISSDMRMIPCCMMASPEVMDLGDARDLAAQWNGPGMISFRREHLQGRIPPPCRTCYKLSSPQGKV